jgi:hypothetical protein
MRIEVKESVLRLLVSGPTSFREWTRRTEYIEYVIVESRIYDRNDLEIDGLEYLVRGPIFQWLLTKSQEMSITYLRTHAGVSAFRCLVRICSI